MSTESAPGRTQLVGRTLELARIEAAIDRLRRRLPQLPIELVGEPGIGKSSLLHAARQAATEFDALILEGRASQFEQDVPYGAAIDALAGHDHGLDRVESSLRHHAHERVRQLLQDLGRERRTLVLLDDLQWADAATQDLVAALLERPPRAPVLLMIAYRVPHGGAPLAPALATAAARGSVQRLHLQPLAAGDAAELLGAGLRRGQLRAVEQLCEGNPFLLTECARALAAGTWQPGDDRPSAGTPDVPPLIASALESELLPLPPPARALLDAAAIAGDPCEIDFARRVAGLDQRAGASALDALVAAGLLRPASDPRSVRFRHPLTREAIHAAVPPGTRRLLHATAAELLTEDGAALSAIAHHTALSAQVGDTAAAELLTRAGRAELARSPATAADWLSVAWRVLPVHERGALAQQHLLFGLAVALSGRGRGREALEILAEATRSVDPRSEEAQRLALGSAVVEATIGDHRAACQRLRALLASMPAAPSLERAQTHRTLAVALGVLGSTAEARTEAETAVRICRELGFPQADIVALPTLAWAHYACGDVAAARSIARRMHDDFSALDDAALAWLIDALATHLRLAMALELPGTEQLVPRAATATTDGLRPILAVEMLATRARLAFRAGRVHEARDLARAAREEAQLLTDPVSSFHALIVVAGVTAEAAPGDEAIEAAEAALAAAVTHGSPAARAAAATLMAGTQLAAGAPARALRTLAGTLEGPDAAAPLPEAELRSALIAADAHGQLGDAAAAAQALDRARQLAARHELPAGRRALRLVEARCALRGGDAAAALAHAADGAAQSRAAGATLEAWTAAVLVARAQAAIGDTEQAAEALRQLEAEAGAAGAVRTAREAAAAQRELAPGGPKPSPRSASGRPTAGLEHPESGISRGTAPRATLTPRQQAIAELAAAGHTNAAIAAQLGVSVKTVEAHLRAAYAKLGVRDRTGLAAAWR